MLEQKATREPERKKITQERFTKTEAMKTVHVRSFPIYLGNVQNFLLKKKMRPISQSLKKICNYKIICAYIRKVERSRRTEKWNFQVNTWSLCIGIYHF